MPGALGGQKVVVFLIGAPGVGKSTISRQLADAFGLHPFHSGQVLRNVAKNAADRRLRQVVQSRMQRSLPMPVDVYCEILRDHVPRGESPGLVFDGYPRNAEQCASIPAVLDTARMSSGSVVGFVLEAPREVLLARSAARWVCERCGQEPHRDGACCPAPELRRRADDSPDRLVSRSRRFYESLPSVREAFAARWPCFDIDAGRSRNSVLVSISRHLQAVSQGLGDL